MNAVITVTPTDSEAYAFQLLSVLIGLCVGMYCLCMYFCVLVCVVIVCVHIHACANVHPLKV